MRASCTLAMFFNLCISVISPALTQTRAGNSVLFTRLSNRLACYFVAIVLIFNHSWSEMHVFDALTMLQLLVSNVYALVTPDKVVLIIFGLRMEKICQMFLQ